MKTPQERSRELTIVSQDPALTFGGKILTSRVKLPAELLGPGPTGFRVQVVDYDTSTNRLYKPLTEREMAADVFAEPNKTTILNDPRFHAQNAYAVVMRTLARFEFALGRRAPWGFRTHQLKVVPHAFAAANAFYSKSDEALFFGYFQGAGGPVFACLSHDVVAHETTHALLDGLRGRYTMPSSPDQAAFHEAFSDVVALLSIYSLPEVVRAALTNDPDAKLVTMDRLKKDALIKGALLGLAKQLGQELQGARGAALRRSAELKPNRTRLDEDPEFKEPHRRGEVLVAAVMRAFVALWTKQIKSLGVITDNSVDLDRVVRDGAALAETLLTSCIRALDYAPPTDIDFSDFLAAVLTADRELHPNDERYSLRQTLKDSFESFGIEPPKTADSEGCWRPPEEELVYDSTHFEAMQREPEEVFRFIWQNRKALELNKEAITRVESLRPCIRVDEDGFTMRETVAEYVQVLRLRADELHRFGIKKPKGMPNNFELTGDKQLYGGGALVFNEHGRLKFHVKNHVASDKQSERLRILWESGFFEDPPSRRSGGAFAQLHMEKMGAPIKTEKDTGERW